MLANIRSNCQRILITAAFALLALIAGREEALAEETLISAERRWTAMEMSAQPSTLAQLRIDSRRSYERNRPTFVITHGMGGTESGDRFHQLAYAICNALPECNVLIVDWSEQSWRTGWLGFPSPFAVAQNIDPVARELPVQYLDRKNNGRSVKSLYFGGATASVASVVSHRYRPAQVERSVGAWRLLDSNQSGNM